MGKGKEVVLKLSLLVLFILVMGIGYGALSDNVYWGESLWGSTYSQYDPAANPDQNPSVTGAQVWLNVSGEENWLQYFVDNDKIGGGSETSSVSSGFRAISTWSDTAGTSINGATSFATEVYDYSSEFDPSTGRFTAKEKGTYLLVVTAYVTSTGSSSLSLTITKNSVEHAAAKETHVALGTPFTTQQVVALVDAEAGDYYDLVVSQTNPDVAAGYKLEYVGSRIGGGSGTSVNTTSGTTTVNSVEMLDSRTLIAERVNGETGASLTSVDLNLLAGITVPTGATHAVIWGRCTGFTNENSAFAVRAGGREICSQNAYGGNKIDTAIGIVPLDGTSVEYYFQKDTTSGYTGLFLDGFIVPKSVGGGSISSLPTCSNTQILQYNGATSAWDCVAAGSSGSGTTATASHFTTLPSAVSIASKSSLSSNTNPNSGTVDIVSDLGVTIPAGATHIYTCGLASAKSPGAWANARASVNGDLIAHAETQNTGVESWDSSCEFIALTGTTFDYALTVTGPSSGAEYTFAQLTLEGFMSEVTVGGGSGSAVETQLWESVDLTSTTDFDTSCQYRISTPAIDSVIRLSTGVSPGSLLFGFNQYSSWIGGYVGSDARDTFKTYNDGWHDVTELEKNCGVVNISSSVSTGSGSSKVVLTSGEKEISGGSGTVTVSEEITITQRGLLDLNGYAQRSYQGGGSVNAGASSVIKVDGVQCSADMSFEGESSSVFFHSAASCVKMLEPGTYTLSLDNRMVSSSSPVLTKLSWGVTAETVNGGSGSSVMTGQLVQFDSNVVGVCPSGYLQFSNTGGVLTCSKS